MKAMRENATHSGIQRGRIESLAADLVKERARRAADENAHQVRGVE